MGSGEPVRLAQFRDLPVPYHTLALASAWLVPFFALSRVDFTTFVLSCLTPRLVKYFPKIMSHVWVYAFSRMNHCERGHEPAKGEHVSGIRNSWLSRLLIDDSEVSFFQKASWLRSGCASCHAQNSPPGVVRFPFLLPKIDPVLFSSPDVTAHALRGVLSTGNPFCA